MIHPDIPPEFINQIVTGDAHKVFDAGWRKRSEVSICSRRFINWMIYRHYLKKWPAIVMCCHVLKVDGKPVGMIVWALPPRETSKRYSGNVWELARLWVDDAIPRNAETWFIAKAVRWIRLNRPDVKVLVSYADPSQGHVGYIYRAANWQADGMTDEERKTPRIDYQDARGKVYHRRSHIPSDAQVTKIHRVSKFRYYLRLDTGKAKPRTRVANTNPPLFVLQPEQLALAEP